MTTMALPFYSDPPPFPFYVDYPEDDDYDDDDDEHPFHINRNSTTSSTNPPPEFPYNNSEFAPFSQNKSLKSETRDGHPLRDLPFDGEGFRIRSEALKREGCPVVPFEA
ncbi:MAG: hypothetical protein ACYDC0_16230 [Acidimicrobiales bacterium]